MKGKVGSIERLRTFGVMMVYQRLWKEPGLRKFFVVHNFTGSSSKNFRRRGSAERWARENREG